MKTSELSGAALNWAVAKCEGVTFGIWSGAVVDEFSNPMMYHDDWGLAGPIIERERIATRFDLEEQEWQATIAAEDEWVYGWGATPLEAAMRCYVTSKLGDEVQIPEEITK